MCANNTTIKIKCMQTSTTHNLYFQRKNCILQNKLQTNSSNSEAPNIMQVQRLVKNYCHIKKPPLSHAQVTKPTSDRRSSKATSLSPDSCIPFLHARRSKFIVAFKARPTLRGHGVYKFPVSLLPVSSLSLAQGRPNLLARFACVAYSQALLLG